MLLPSVPPNGVFTRRIIIPIVVFTAIALQIVLVTMSLACWFVILTKLWDQRSISNHFRLAQRNFWSAGNLHDGIASLGAGENVFRMLAEDGIRASHYYQGHLTEKVALNDWLAVATLQ